MHVLQNIRGILWLRLVLVSTACRPAAIEVFPRLGGSEAISVVAQDFTPGPQSMFLDTCLVMRRNIDIIIQGYL